MASNFPQLIQSGRIGSMTVKNRMIVTAMGVNLAEPDGHCGEQIIAFHERQAEGGAGLIILGVTGVAWPHGGNLPRQIAISDDRFLPGLTAMAEAVHRHGAKVACQLHHGGLVAAQDSKEGRPIWVPSYPEKSSSDLFDGMLETEIAVFHDPDAPPPQLHVMTQDDINTLVAQFADAAERAKKAGLDGCEIHAGHGYIISEFLSPLTNCRDDQYGGCLGNRARLLLEIITAIRARVGREYPIWCKLDSEEFGKSEGISLADAKATARMTEAAGVDAITVTAYHDPGRGALHSESNIPHVPERLVANATAMKQVVNIPIITAGRIEPSGAEKHIKHGDFDFFAMGRKMLADPDIANKIILGTPEQIRPCVYCYCCVSQIYTLKPVKCAVNPETAFERERKLLIASDSGKHIAVVGGGPAGMEVARRLSQRGFKVTLIERDDRLGGTLQFASIAYPPNQRLLDWLSRQLTISNVEVMLETEATTALLQQLSVDEVVVATGAERLMPDIPGGDKDFVFSGDEMRALVLAQDNAQLTRKTSATTRWLVKAGALSKLTKNAGVLRQASKLWLPLGQRVVIIGAELVGLELAEFLAERGRKVTVVDSANRAGQGLYLVRRLRLLEELKHLGVTIINRAQQIAIEDQQVSYQNYRGQTRHLDADHVIVAKGATGNTRLAEQLTEAGFNTHTIGDCNGVGYIEGAIASAAELAVKIN